MLSVSSLVAANTSWLMNAMLLSIRLSALFLISPLMTTFPVPATVRVLFVFMLAAVLTFGFPYAQTTSPLSWGETITAAIGEWALGALLALGVSAAFSAFALGGQILDIQIGYGISQVFDPVSNRQIPILSAAFNQLAVVAFFLADGHHLLMRGLALSLERFPLGTVWSLADGFLPVVRLTSSIFTLGFALVAPVVFCIFLVELALGVVARNLPQMNMFAMSLPIKVALGLAALSLWLVSAGSITSRIFALILQFWDQLFWGRAHG